tara:strand:- start:465 stop:1430 length:966 start_codon:yes stop_codon:yes gene_type:complete
MQAVSFPGIAPGHTQEGPFSTPYNRLPSNGVPMPTPQPELFPPLLPGITREILHDPALVSVSAKHIRCRGKKFNLVTPFAGKKFCFSDYMRGIRRLPLEKAHAVWYDNSNDPKFHKKLQKTLEENFDSWILLQDRNKAHTVESTDQYAYISYRCHRIYRELYLKQICHSVGLCVNIEDDVEIPKGTWEKLTSILELYPEVGTAVGACRSRRMKDRPLCHPMAWHFERVESIGPVPTVKVRIPAPIIEKPLGLEMIGASHMGCWFTRTPLIKKIGMNYDVDGLRAQDMCWGYQLNQAGIRMAVDWSVKAKHFGKRDGVKTSV